MVSRYSDIDTKTLMQSIAKGEGDALQAFSLRYGQKMFSIALRMLGDEAQAEDALQDTLIKIWQKAPSWVSEKASAYTWSVRILMNTCTDMLRARKNEIDLSAIIDWYADEEAFIKMDVALDYAYLGEQISKLPEEQKFAVILTYYEDMTNKEVSEVLNKSVKAVESLLVRARQTLRDSEEVQQLRKEAV